MVMISFDINEFLGVPLFLLWCFIMVMAATALGNILAVIFETLTGKEQKYPVQIIFSSILTLIGIAYALYAKNNYFMGEIEADLVFFAAIIPFGINAVRWIVKWHIHKIKNCHDEQ